MKLDKYICKGGRLNKKDILGIKINGKHIYPIVDSIYNIYEIEVPSDVNSACNLYFKAALNIASKNIASYFEFSGGINPTIENYEFIDGDSGYKCTFNTPGFYTVKTTEFLYMPFTQTYNLKVYVKTIRTDIVNAKQLFRGSAMASFDCFRIQGPALTELANIDYLFWQNNNLLNMTFEDIKAPNLTSAVGPVYNCTALQTLKFINCEMPNLTTASNLTYYCYAPILELANCDFSGSTDIITPISSSTEPQRNTTHFKMTNCKFDNATTALSLSVKTHMERFEITDCNFSSVTSFTLWDESNIERLNFSGNILDGLTSSSYFRLSSEYADILDLSNCSMKNIESIRFNSGYGCNFKKIIFDGVNFSSLTDLYSAFREMTQLEEVDLSNTITGEIINLNYSFYGCESLKKVVFNDKITSLANCRTAFMSCSSLKEVDMRYANLTSDCDAAAMFSGCTSLTTLRLDNCSNDTINKIITSYNFPKFTSGTHKIYCKEANASGLTAPSGWVFSYVD